MKKLINVFLVLSLIVGLTGCNVGNADMSEGLTNESNTFNYILTLEAGEYHFHEVYKWKDSESDALGVTTKCCGNQFWTSYNVSVLYTNMPEYLPENVIICAE